MSVTFALYIEFMSNDFFFLKEAEYFFFEIHNFVFKRHT